MQRCPLAIAALQVIVLVGCTQTNYTNVDHPAFGQSDYNKDLTECRAANSRVEHSGGYTDVTHTVVDEAAVKSCVTGRGWREATP